MVGPWTGWFATHAWPRRRPALRLAGHLLALWITAWVFNLFNHHFLHSDDFGYDEQFFVWGGWSITKGLIPYKEFLEFKPPFVFITHALALKLFGFEEFRYRTFFCLFPMASILMLQASLMLRRVDRILATTLAVCAVAIFVNPALHDTALSDSESIGLTYFFLGFAFLLLESPYRNATDAAGAALMACCVLSKEPFAPTVLTTWASVFLLRDGLVEFRTKALRYVKFTGLGAAAVLAILCAYMVPTGSMRAYLRMAGSYARIYRDPTLSYCVVLGRFHPSTPMNELKTQWEGIRNDFLNLNSLGYMVPMFAAAFVYITRRSLLLLATTVAGLGAGLWAVTASNCQWNHYYNMTLAGFFAFLAIGLDTMKVPFSASDRWTRMFIRIAMAGTAAIAVYPRYEAESLARARERAQAKEAAQAQPVPAKRQAREPIPGLFALVASRSVDTDRIFTTGPPGLYVSTNRLSATRESNIIDEILGVYRGATDEERLRPVYDELVNSMPKIVVLDPENAQRKQRHMKALVIPFLTNYHYNKIADYIYVRPY